MKQKILLIVLMVMISGFSFADGGTSPISYGSEYVFNSDDTAYNSVASLNSTCFVSVYKDINNSGYGTAIIGTVSGNTISYGSEYVFNSGNTDYTFVASLDAAHFVVSYRDASNSAYGTSVVGTVSGNTISYGSEYVFNPAITTNIAVAYLNSTHFVVSYRDASFDGTSIIGAVSGTTISYGAEYVFSPQTDYISVSAMNSTHFVVSYCDVGNSDYGTSIIGVVSGTTISYGAEYVFNSGITIYIAVASLNSTKFVVSYRDIDNSNYGTSIIGNISGNVISYGAEYVFNPATTSYCIFVASLDSSHFVVSYCDAGNSDYGTSIIGTVSGNVISYGTEHIFNPFTTTYCMSVASLDDTSFVVSYRDVGNSNYGASVIGTVLGDVISYGSEYVFNNGYTDYTSVASLNSTCFVSAYKDLENSGYGTATIGIVSRDNIFYGSEYVFNNGYTDFISVSAMNSTHFVVSYRDAGNSNYGTSVIGTVSGTTITYGAEYVFNPAITYSGYVSAFNSTHFVVSYRDAGNSNYGTSIIGNISGNVISYGAEYVFNAVTVAISVSAMNSTHFVVSYRDTSHSSYGTSIIGNISGNVISYGAEYVFNTDTTVYISVASLDNTSFAISYCDTGNSDYGTSITGTVSGNVISYGSEYVFNAGTSYYHSVASLDNTSFAVSYRDNDNSFYGTSIIGTVTENNEISYGDKAVFNEGTTDYISASSLDSNYYVIGYIDISNNNYGTAVIGWNDAPTPVIGYIIDTNGRAMAGINVNITNNNTGAYVIATSDNVGFYTCNIKMLVGDVLFANVTAAGGIHGTNESTVLDNDTQWINVTVTPALFARFTHTPTSPRVDEPVYFNDLSDGDIIRWSWDFGDGNTGIGKSQEHIYHGVGSYVVNLLVTSSSGYQDDCTVIIFVSTLEEPSIPPPIEPDEPEGYPVSDMYSVLKVDDVPMSNNAITVVIIDTGYTPTIYNNINMKNIEGRALSRFDSAYDDNGHGTFTIYEIMYITQNKCPNTKIISFKTFDKYGSAEPGEFLDALDAVKYMRPDIVSISAGAIGNPMDEYSMKIKEMRESGIIVIAAAAGNLGPAPSTILSPACSDYAIAVGSFDTKGTLSTADDRICLWSSRGPVPDISPKPDVVAPGESILGPWLYAERAKSGTSMSTPLITGGTALVVANNKPLLDVVRLMYFWNLGVIGDAYEESLKDSCTLLGDENAWGAGVPDFGQVNSNFRNRLLLLIILPIVIIALIGMFLFYFSKKRKGKVNRRVPSRS